MPQKCAGRDGSTAYITGNGGDAGAGTDVAGTPAVIHVSPRAVRDSVVHLFGAPALVTIAVANGRIARGATRFRTAAWTTLRHGERCPQFVCCGRGEMAMQ